MFSSLSTTTLETENNGALPLHSVKDTLFKAEFYSQPNDR